MKKLKLEIGELSVESFPTRADDEGVRGTVAGRNEPGYTESCDGSCVNTCISCVNTCLNTCPASCWNTCNTCYGTCDAWCTHPG
ncbi:MAG TPA: hypothetical protein VFJ82_10070 [Longimicrobium sp.]|nr:hypothetical protein [Longimicrobium sp.]